VDGIFLTSPDPVRARTGGAQVVGAVEEYDYGCFGGSVDPDGNKIDRWQVSRGVSASAVGPV
jgi:hypothetical protein